MKKIINMNIEKSTKVKPMFYSVVLEPLKIIAKEFGYNLLIHGSMDRDMDLVLVAWQDNCVEAVEVIKAFTSYLGGNIIDQRTASDKEPVYLKAFINGAGRLSALINLNRDNRFNSYGDDQWYLDISVIPKA
jgi:hypothetical protein